jgi:peptidoglycan/xylan/chitin deacetylase (PgdA/CDA1 family)
MINNKIGYQIVMTVVTIADCVKFFDIYAFLRRKITKSQVAIITYHRICPKNNNWSLEPTPPHLFRQQMEYFLKHYELISLIELVRRLLEGKNLPQKAVIITFDDSYTDTYLYAYPFLKEHHIPATFFLTTGPIKNNTLFWWDKVGYIIQHMKISEFNLFELGNFLLSSDKDRLRVQANITEALKLINEDRKSFLINKLLDISGVDIPSNLTKELILSWDQVKDMSNNGITFGAHTVNHSILTNMPLKQAEWEITQSKRDIENVLNKDINLFSYPNGDFNFDLISIIKESGFDCAVSFGKGKFITFNDNVFALIRFPPHNNFSLFKFDQCGLLVDLRKLLNIGR